VDNKHWPLRRKPDPIHDWFEDFDHENGMYECKCCNCGVFFVGHKRRIVCFDCASKAKERVKDTGFHN
jgi:uncharacterized OB-fold protein